MYEITTSPEQECAEINPKTTNNTDLTMTNAENGTDSERPPWQIQEKLEEIYVNQDTSLREAADELGTTKSTVRRWLKRYGYEIRNSRPPKNDRPWQDEDKLNRLLNIEDYSIREAASELGCSEDTLKTWMERLDVKKHNFRELQSPKHPWRSERKLWELLVFEDLSIEEAAEELDTDAETIEKWIGIFNL